MKPNLPENEVTQPSELRDFFEWHQGIPYYGFWGIEIDNQESLQRIESSKKILADQLHPNYLRQSHITLSPSGLIDPKHFSSDSLKNQIAKIKAADLSAFSLYLSEPNTFTTAPYLSIHDPSSSLTVIRDILHSISHGEDADEYIPHVTLGFYNNIYKISDILAQFAPHSFSEIEFPVTEIIFARYSTHEIQGRYEVLHRIPLNQLSI